MKEKRIAKERKIVSWLNALTLSERTELLNGRKKHTNKVVQNTETKGFRQLKKWKTELTIAEDAGLFFKRLAMDNLDEDDLYYLLNIPAEVISEKFSLMPVWLRNLEAVTELYEKVSVSSKEELRHQSLPGFCSLIVPFILDGQERFRQGARKLVDDTSATHPFDVATAETTFVANLIPQLALHKNPLNHPSFCATGDSAQKLGSMPSS